MVSKYIHHLSHHKSSHLTFLFPHSKKNGNAKVNVVTRWSQGCSIIYKLVTNTKVVTRLVTRLSQGQMVIRCCHNHTYMVAVNFIM